LKGSIPPDPNDESDDLSKITYYLQTLAPPPRGEITPAVSKGETTFKMMGCAACHMPQYKTGPKIMVINPDGPPLRMQEVMGPDSLIIVNKPPVLEVKALEKKPVNAYSDFLVHDMGPALSDGITQYGTTGSEWRTTPLWGLRFRSNYLHDGRAKTISEAILMHGGEASESQKAAARLLPAEREDLMAFLNSL
jgi:CxxC motif-containing protein (DUF1111 family)